MTYPFYPFVPIYTEHFKVDSMALEQRIYVSYFKLSQLFMKSVYMYLNLIKYKVLFGIHVPVFIVQEYIHKLVYIKIINLNIHVVKTVCLHRGQRSHFFYLVVISIDQMCRLIQAKHTCFSFNSLNISDDHFRSNLQDSSSFMNKLFSRHSNSVSSRYPSLKIRFYIHYV